MKVIYKVTYPTGKIYIEPQLVAQIEFTEWKPDGHLRHSKFVGLRDDKNSHEAARE